MALHCWLTSLSFSSSLAKSWFNIVITSHFWHLCRNCCLHIFKMPEFLHLCELPLYQDIFPGYLQWILQQFDHQLCQTLAIPTNLPGRCPFYWLGISEPVPKPHFPWTTHGTTCVNSGFSRSSLQNRFSHERDVLLNQIWMIQERKKE